MVGKLSDDVIDGFIEYELDRLPRADQHPSRRFRLTVAKGQTFPVVEKGVTMEFPNEMSLEYIALEPIKGLPIRLWFRHVAKR